MLDVAMSQPATNGPPKLEMLVSQVPSSTHHTAAVPKLEMMVAAPGMTQPHQVQVSPAGQMIQIQQSDVSAMIMSQPTGAVTNQSTGNKLGKGKLRHTNSPTP